MKQGHSAFKPKPSLLCNAKNITKPFPTRPSLPVRSRTTFDIGGWRRSTCQASNVACSSTFMARALDVTSFLAFCTKIAASVPFLPLAYRPSFSTFGWDALRWFSYLWPSLFGCSRQIIHFAPPVWPALTGILWEPDRNTELGKAIWGILSEGMQFGGDADALCEAYSEAFVRTSSRAEWLVQEQLCSWQHHAGSGGRGGLIIQSQKGKQKKNWRPLNIRH